MADGSERRATWRDSTNGQCAGLKIQRIRFDSLSFHERVSNKQKHRSG